MGPTGDIVRVVQIHPTRRCNLRCKHCYTSSGPELAGELSAELITSLLAELSDEGFNTIAVSGGEPLLWRPLLQVLQAARALGLVTSITTNGLLLDPHRLARLAPHLSLLVVSIDGKPGSHDNLRARDGAFARTQRKLQYVRNAGVPFGIIFALTLENMHELPWVTAFAVEQGASLLQVHPLERVGRAREYTLYPPDDLELAYGFVAIAKLQEEYSGRLTIQFDVADRSLVAREPCRAFAIETPGSATTENALLADIVSPLVLQEDGWIVPVQHGFDTRYAIAHLEHGSFRAQAARWKGELYPAFLDLSRRVWDEMRNAPDHLPFTNWYEAISARSAQVEIAAQ